MVAPGRIRRVEEERCDLVQSPRGWVSVGEEAYQADAAECDFACLEGAVAAAAVADGGGVCPGVLVGAPGCVSKSERMWRVADHVLVAGMVGMVRKGAEEDGHAGCGISVEVADGGGRHKMVFVFGGRRRWLESEGLQQPWVDI